MFYFGGKKNSKYYGGKRRNEDEDEEDEGENNEDENEDEDEKPSKKSTSPLKIIMIIFVSLLFLFIIAVLVAYYGFENDFLGIFGLKAAQAAQAAQVAQAAQAAQAAQTAQAAQVAQAAQAAQAAAQASNQTSKQAPALQSCKSDATWGAQTAQSGFTIKCPYNDQTALCDNGTWKNIGVCETPIPFTLSSTQKNTGFNDSGNGQLIYLDRHTLDCSTGPIHDLQLVRDPANSNNIRYNYHCADGGNFGPVMTRSTPSTSEGANNAKELIGKHLIQCDPQSVLSKIRLTRDGNGKFHYDYSCLPSKTQMTCTKYTTGANDDGNGSTFWLDRHNISCPADESLSQLQLVQSGDNKYKYEYSCCKNYSASK